MSVKFKIGFTITPEVLFGIISKVLPLEDLHIEQMIETPMPDPAIRFDKRFDLPKPAKRKSPKQYKKRPSIPLKLDRGINAIIMGMLKAGPRKAVELKLPLKAGGYSMNSVGSRLQNLEEHGIVERMKNNTWRIKDDAGYNMDNKRRETNPSSSDGT